MKYNPKNMVAPFPYNGGKRRSSDEFWHKVGTPDVYIEPFVGSMAVLLGAPRPCKLEIVCDIDPFIVNFWRAMKQSPHDVARWADYPTYHHDLTARHHWLVNWMNNNAALLKQDEFCDIQVAGWWVWGISNWIGGGWCIYTNPNDKRPMMQHTGNGAGVSANRFNLYDHRPSIDDRGGGRGVSVNRMNLHEKRPYIRPSGGGRGVSAQRVEGIHEKRPFIRMHPGGIGVSAQRLDIDTRFIGDGSRLFSMFEDISERIKNVKILYGDWKQVFEYQDEIDQYDDVAFFLDPPYLTEERSSQLYVTDVTGNSSFVAQESYEWSREHENKYKIAYCSHEGDFDFSGWGKTLKTFSTYRNKNDKLDEINYSPACDVKQAEISLLL